MIIAVTGSSGFIGSRLCVSLLELGHQVCGLDISSTINKIQNNNYTSCQVDITNYDAIRAIFLLLKPDVICHLSAKIKVDESERDPSMYYLHNVIATYNILECAKLNNSKIIFASSTAVYGTPSCTPYKEEDSMVPASVYGSTKLIGENMIKDYSTAYGINSVIFRFFNAAGGSDIGVPYHLIPRIIYNLSHNITINIYGTNYPTKDGTCIRDYIHVTDITDAFSMAIAHLHELDHQNITNTVKVYNLGTECGYSVDEIVKRSIHIYSKVFPDVVCKPVVICDRRKGDPPFLLANCDAVNNSLGWKARFTIDEIIFDTIKDYMGNYNLEYYKELSSN